MSGSMNNRSPIQIFLFLTCSVLTQQWGQRGTILGDWEEDEDHGLSLLTADVYQGFVTTTLTDRPRARVDGREFCLSLVLFVKILLCWISLTF